MILLTEEMSNNLAEAFPDRFIPRYAIVSFCSIPYSEVYSRGEIQADIIDQLSMQSDSAGNINLELAGRLINEKLSPVVS